MLYSTSPTLNAYKVYGVYYATCDHSSLDHWSYCHKDEAVLPFLSKLPHTTALKSIQPALITYIKRAVWTFKYAMQNNTSAKLEKLCVNLFPANTAHISNPMAWCILPKPGGAEHILFSLLETSFNYIKYYFLTYSHNARFTSTLNCTNTNNSAASCISITELHATPPKQCENSSMIKQTSSREKKT